MKKFDPNQYDAADICRRLGVEISHDNKILCVLHDDTNPSLHVYDHNYYCYTCKKKVSIVDLVIHKMNYGALDDPKAFKSAVQWIEGGKSEDPTPGAVFNPKSGKEKKDENKPPAVYPAPLSKVIYRWKEKGGNEWNEAAAVNVYAYIPPGEKCPVMAVVDFGRVAVKYDGKGEPKKLIRLFTPIEFDDKGMPTKWISRSPVKAKDLKWFNIKAVSPNRIPLYNQNRILPGCPILIVEGEKCAFAAQKWFDKNPPEKGKKQVVAVSYRSEFKSGLSTLGGHPVVIWPDNDKDGMKAAANCVKILSEVGVSEISVINPIQSWAPGYDVYDWLQENPDGDLRAYLRENRKKVLMDGENPNFSIKPKPDIVDKKPPEPIIPLGGDSDNLYFFSCRFGLVQKLAKGSSAMAQRILSLEPDMSYWEGIDLIDATNGKLRVNEAAQHLLEMTAKVGMYDPNKVRRKGIFWDGEKIVANTGNMLFVDRHQVPIENQSGLKFVYEKCDSPSHIPPDAEMMDKIEARALLSLLLKLRFTSRVQSAMLLGFLVQCIVSGALRWRTHCWLSAERGSGKTWVLTEIVRRILGKNSFYFGGARTTEAGLRRRLQASAFGCIFDEAEVVNKNDIEAKEAIMHLLRSATDATEESKVTVQGVSGGGSSVSYLVRSPFLMSSIGISVSDEADISRFIFLRLNGANKMTEAEFEQFQNECKKMFSGDFSAKFFLRCFHLAPKICEAVEIFSRVLTNEKKTVKRGGDTYGTILACYYVFANGHVPSEREARLFVNKINIEKEIEMSDKSESDEVYEMILSHEFYRESKPPYRTLTVGQVLSVFGSQNDNGEARAELNEKFGIRVFYEDDDGDERTRNKKILRIFGDSPAIRDKIFARSKFLGSWYGILTQHRGALPKEGKRNYPRPMPKSIGFGRRTRKYTDIVVDEYEGEGDEGDY